MFSALNYTSNARSRLESATNDLQKIFEIPSTSIEEILNFPNVISELQTPINTHGFFTPEKIEYLISIIFDSTTISKYTFDEGRKYAYISSELLSNKIPSISEYFFHKEAIGHFKKSGKVDELDNEGEFDVGKDILLSPVNSAKSKSQNFVEICNKNAINLLLTKTLKKEDMTEIRAGYLSKILNSFFQKSKNEFLNFLYKSGSDFSIFLNFLDLSSISDFLNNVVLYENCMNNDSMIFQESQVQISSEFSQQRIQFFVNIVFCKSIADKFETAYNIKMLIESFFSKYKNISDSDEIITIIFTKRQYFSYLKNLITKVEDQSILHEILSIIKIVSNFLVFATNAKNEVLNDQVKAIFDKSAPAYKELLELMSAMNDLQKTTKRKELKTTTFKEFTTNSGTKNHICITIIFTNLIKQKICPVHSFFDHEEFLIALLVN